MVMSRWKRLVFIWSHPCCLEGAFKIVGQTSFRVHCVFILKKFQMTFDLCVCYIKHIGRQFIPRCVTVIFIVVFFNLEFDTSTTEMVER